MVSLRRTALFRSPVFQEHETGNHPENASRLRAIDRELLARDLLTNRPNIPFQPANDEAIGLIHDSSVIKALDDFAREGGGWIDQDTLISPCSVDAARLACGASIAAVDAMIAGTIDRGFVLARPPGHHATPIRPMGFCLFNTVAVAAAHARRQGIERVAIIDWDVHHGNGTQDAFYTDPSVLYCSLHQSPLYPGSGSATEQGWGPGEGFTVNVPISAGTDDASFLYMFTARIESAVHAFRPNLLLISAGYDAHRDDALADTGLQLTNDGFQELTKRVVALADEYSKGRVLFVLEGGYDPPTLAGCVADAITILDRADGEAPQNHVSLAR